MSWSPGGPPFPDGHNKNFALNRSCPSRWRFAKLRTTARFPEGRCAKSGEAFPIRIPAGLGRRPPGSWGTLLALLGSRCGLAEGFWPWPSALPAVQPSRLLGIVCYINMPLKCTVILIDIDVTRTYATQRETHRIPAGQHRQAG